MGQVGQGYRNNILKLVEYTTVVLSKESGSKYLRRIMTLYKVQWRTYKVKSKLAMPFGRRCKKFLIIIVSFWGKFTQGSEVSYGKVFGFIFFLYLPLVVIYKGMGNRALTVALKTFATLDDGGGGRGGGSVPSGSGH